MLDAVDQTLGMLVPILEHFVVRGFIEHFVARGAIKFLRCIVPRLLSICEHEFTASAIGTRHDMQYEKSTTRENNSPTY
jgi:hypothetical protein